MKDQNIVTAEDIVRQNVYYCASMLVSDLSKLPQYQDELLEVSLTQDWEEPAGDYIRNMKREEIVEALEEASFECGENEVVDGLREALLQHLKDENALQDFCEEHGLDAYDREAYEHWIVSDWLADRLEEHGEMVLRDFLGLTLWGRCTTGQGISIDSVIEAIHAEMVRS